MGVLHWLVSCCKVKDAIEANEPVFSYEDLEDFNLRELIESYDIQMFREKVDDNILGRKDNEARLESVLGT